MERGRSGESSYFRNHYNRGIAYIDKGLPTVGKAGLQKYSLTAQWTLETTTTAIYLVRRPPTWLASWAGHVDDVSCPKYVLAYRYPVTREDGGDVTERGGADLEATAGQEKESPRFATIYRWELVLVWEYLRQVLINREQLWVAMRDLVNIEGPVYHQLSRWQGHAYYEFTTFGRRLDHLARFESNGQIPRQWKGGKPDWFPAVVESIDKFEGAFFAYAKRYLDGFAVDGPAGYPLEQTRRFEALDGKQPPFPWDQHKIIDRWDSWVRNDGNIALCIELSEQSMTTSSSSGTIKTQSSTSEVEAYLAVDEHGQEDTTPLLVLERVPSHVGPVSAKLADLYDIERSTRRFSPEFWVRGRVITLRFDSDTPLREASERFEKGAREKAMDD